MAYQVTTNVLGALSAGEDLSAKQFYAVKLSSGAVVLPTVAGQACIGLLQNAPTSGSAAEVQVAAVGKGWLGGTVTADDRLTVTSAGKLVTSTAEGDNLLGYALESGTDGKVISVLVTPRLPRMFALSFPIALATIADGDIVTAYPLAFAGVITKFTAVTTVKATTGSKLSTLNIEIGATNCTGGTLALTTAGCDTLGKVTASAAFTANNTFAVGDTLSIEAASTTAFGEGEIVVHIEGYQL